MNRPISRTAIIGTIIKKDLIESIRDWLWILLSMLGLVFYVTVFWLLPDTVDEKIPLGVHHTGMDFVLQELIEAEEEGLEVIVFESSEHLRAAVAGEIKTDREVRIGIDFPNDFLAKIMRRETTTVRLYLTAGVPKEVRRAMSSMVSEIAHMISGNELPVTEPDEQTVVLGQDRLGNQIPLRDKMRPLLAFFMLMSESFALASLIAGEVQAKTLTAVLVTPARVVDVLTAKIIIGTLLAFVQAVVLLLAVNALDKNPLLLLSFILLGAVMVTGIAMITGAAGKDFMSTLFLGILFMLLLAIPAFALLFPGTASNWVTILPSYGIMEGIFGTTVYGRGWGGSLPYLALTAIWDTIILGSGLLVLRKKIVTL